MSARHRRQLRRTRERAALDGCALREPQDRVPQGVNGKLRRGRSARSANASEVPHGQ